MIKFFRVLGEHQYLFLLCVSIFYSSCQKSNNAFEIVGEVDTSKNDTQIYLYDADLNKVVDSSKVRNGRYNFKGSVKNFKNYYVHTGNFTEYKLVWVENTIININAHNTLLGQAKITGSNIQTQSDAWYEIDYGWSRKMDSLKRVMEQISTADSLNLYKQISLMGDYEDQKTKIEIQFIKSHADYDLAPYFIFSISNKIHLNEIKNLFNGLSKDVKSNKWGLKVYDYITKFEKLQIGAAAPNFILPDFNGKETSLFSLRGKYVLLEFWVSSCDMCRNENINLLEAYRKYKDNGFEILGVCLDQSKDEWALTIKSDTILWRTVSDLQGISGKVPSMYDINYIPASFLLDTEGVIIDKDLGGNILHEKLDSLFKNYSN